MAPRALAVLALVIAAVLGPRVTVDESDLVAPELPEGDLDAWLRASEGAVPGVRSGDEREVVWADAPGGTTDLAVVYLHGFSADRHELDPVPLDVARALEANLFYARLTGHGRDGPAMAEARVEDWLRDTEEAIAVGRRIGGRVVLMGTSTGATLATWAAARERWRDALHATVLISPNYGLRDGRSRMLLWPWGAALARLVAGAERCFEPVDPEQARHWTTCYPTRALLPMAALAEHVRTMDPSRVEAPVLLLYSPKDEIVDTRETERLFVGFASSLKRMTPLAGSARAQHHVLAGDILSPETNEEVTRMILEFLDVVADTLP